MSRYLNRSETRVVLVLVPLFLSTALSCSRPELAAEPARVPQEPAGHTEHDDDIVELMPEAADRAGIRTAPVEERVLAGELRTTGRVDFDEDRLAHVSPRLSGRVHRVDAKLGQDVGAGDKLAEIDSIELGRAKAEYLQARARDELARTSFERVRGLFADRIIPEQQVLEAEAERRKATVAVATSEETLHLFGLTQEQVDSLSYDDSEASHYPLRAPFAGTIVARHATLGEMVTPERNLFTLADLSRVWIWIDVAQRDLADVHPGDGAEARVDAFPGEIFAGTVSFLSARVDEDTRTVRARIDVANAAGKLRPGMFVEVRLVDPHAQDGRAAAGVSRVVPESAVTRDGDADIVFVALAERRYKRCEVKLGRRAGGDVEVLGDILEPGTPVVVDGTFFLKSAGREDAMGQGHAH